MIYKVLISQEGEEYSDYSKENRKVFSTIYEQTIILETDKKLRHVITYLNKEGENEGI